MAVKRVIQRKKAISRNPKKARVAALPKKRRVASPRRATASRRATTVRRAAPVRRTTPVRRTRGIQEIAFKAPPLVRHEANPIIEPHQGHYWEMKATFNPAAVYADNRVHLLYRAIGGSDVSVLGYASSEDGVRVDERLAQPAFVPIIRKKDDALRAEIPPPVYSSGGGWNGGCEDPRLILINDNVYLMYTAFDGWGSIRIAMASISLADFLAKKWNWGETMLLSPPGEVHKNWVLFPEKINGKFAVLHSISPNILIDYVDDLNEFQSDERFIKSHYHRVSNTKSWDSWVRGAGPPPIKTKLGWLLFYHAMDTRDPNRYKLGAMILDAGDPTKILYRTKAPILEPDEWYENTGWKSGVVYSCGAVVKDGKLYVYYGGADSVSCVAMANLDTFLEEIKKHGVAKLAPQAKAQK